MLPRHKPQPSRDLAAVLKAVGIRNRCDQRAGRQRADARYLLQLAAELATAVPGDDLLLEVLHLPIEFFEMLSQSLNQMPERYGQFIAASSSSSGTRLATL
jgi:hypothetical protein